MRTYKNPILYADYSDPDVVRVGEDYYMVSSSFTYIPGVPLLHSRDLVHWELINHCVKKLPFEKYALPCHGSGTWAPSIRYHEGTFFVFIPLVDEGILVARSKDPYGEFEWNMLNYQYLLVSVISGQGKLIFDGLHGFCLCKEPLRYKTPAVAGGNRSPVPLPADRAQAYI